MVCMDIGQILILVGSVICVVSFSFSWICERVIIPRMIKRAKLIKYDGASLPIRNGFLEFNKNPKLN